MTVNVSTEQGIVITIPCSEPSKLGGQTLYRGTPEGYTEQITFDPRMIQ